MIINTYLIHYSKVPEAILIQTLEKGTESLAMRRKAEYHLFTRSELKFLSEFTLNPPPHYRHGSEPKISPRYGLCILSSQQRGAAPLKHLASPRVHIQGVP